MPSPVCPTDKNGLRVRTDAASDDEAICGVVQRSRHLASTRRQKLVVYGSQTRGEARLDSDTDLMIVLGGRFRPDEKAQRTSRLVIRLANEYGVALSPLHLSGENFERDRPLPRAARREGVVL